MLLINFAVAVGISTIVVLQRRCFLRSMTFLGIAALQLGLFLIVVVANLPPYFALGLLCLFHALSFEVFSKRTALTWLIMSVIGFGGILLCGLADCHSAELLYPGGCKAWFDTLIMQVGRSSFCPPGLTNDAIALGVRWSTAMQSQIETQVLSIPIALSIAFSTVDRRLAHKFPNPVSKQRRQQTVSAQSESMSLSVLG